MISLRELRHVLCIVTERCNLGCTTCYAGSGGAAASLPLDDARAALELLLAGTAQGVVHWSLSGGEPLLLGREWLAALLRCGEEAAARNGRRVVWELQSNLLLLDDAMLELLDAHRVCLGTSIDGPPELQELHRPGSAGTLERFAWLAAHGRPPGVLCVLSAASHGRRRRLIETFAALRAPVVKLAALRPHGRAALAPPSARQLLEIRLEIAAALLAGRCLLFDPDLFLYLDYFLGGRPAGGCDCTTARCGAGLTSISLDVDGVLHPCIQPARARAFPIGDVRGGLAADAADRVRAFHGSDAWTVRCFECAARRICFFGCRAVAHAGGVSGAGAAIGELECRFTRLLWRHLVTHLQEAVRLHAILASAQRRLEELPIGQVYAARPA